MCQRTARAHQLPEQHFQAVAHQTRHDRPAPTNLAGEQTSSRTTSGGRLVQSSVDIFAVSDRRSSDVSANAHHAHIANAESPKRAVQRANSEAQLSSISGGCMTYRLAPCNEIRDEETADLPGQRRTASSKSRRERIATATLHGHPPVISQKCYSWRLIVKSRGLSNYKFHSFRFAELGWMRFPLGRS